MSNDPSDIADTQRAGWIIFTMCLTVGLVIAGVGGLTVTIPEIGAELGATQSELQWVLDAFALTLAALLLLMGALGDRFGRKRLMLVGLSIMVVTGLWAGWSGSIGPLIVARAAGGVGAAMVFPGTLASITATMPDERRGLAIGLWTASASLGGTIGSFIAGALIEAFWWGSVFVGIAVASAAAAVFIWRFVPETSDPAHANLDPMGALLSLVGIGGLVFAIIEGPVKGWSDPLTVLGFVGGFLGLSGFIWWELRTDSPLLDVRLFLNRGFATGTLSIFMQFTIVFGYFFVAAQYLAFVSGYSPLVIASALLPVGVLLPLTSVIAPRLAAQFGRGPVGGGGLALMAIGCVATAMIDVSANYLAFAGAIVVFGAGMGFAATPATEAIVEALPAAKQGVASAANDLARELGAAIGIAVLGSALTSGYRQSIDAAEIDLPPASLDVVRDSAASGLAVAAQAGDVGAPVLIAVQEAVGAGFETAMWLAAGLLASAAFYVAVRSPRREPSNEATYL